MSPDIKQCNFDCLYCELQGSKTVNIATKTPSIENIVNALKSAFLKHKNIDVITLTANGEPTLYPELDGLIDEVNLLKNGAKSLILSNGSTIASSKIQNSLKKLDIVKLSLDCATHKCFKKLDRPHKEIDLMGIIEGMKNFRKIYNGELVIEILVVSGLNDTVEEFEALHKILLEIKPNRIDIGTIDRPPAYKVQGVSMDKLIELREVLDGLHVNIAYKKNYIPEKRNFSEDEILELLKRRPQSKEDVALCFDEKSILCIESLISKEQLQVKKIAGVEFYSYNTTQ